MTAIDTSLPSWIGRYRIERELGRGSMGVVYQAYDPNIGRPVAIKLVRADLLEGANREEFLARFRREAQAAGRCVHPNIVSLYDFSLHDGNPFLAMEYIDGVGLGQALKRTGRFAPARAVAIIVQLLDALGAAHALGIVHRDIKPANILLLPGDQVKVTDFGISRFSTSELTLDGRIVGTPAYMSPEQCRGEIVDLRTDLFSTGSVLYELLSGVRPFPGRNATDISHRLLHTEPRDLAQLVEGVAEKLTIALGKAMRKSREERYASAEQMQTALREALREAFPPVVPPAHAGSVSDSTKMLRVSRPSPRQIEHAERVLMLYIGPIARLLIARILPDIVSGLSLWERLAPHIEDAADRTEFLARMPRDLRPAAAVPEASPQPGSDGLSRAARPSPEQVARAERALVRQVGPVGRLLVKRAMPDVESEMALWDRLASHIDSSEERQAFLRERKE